MPSCRFELFHCAGWVRGKKVNEGYPYHHPPTHTHTYPPHLAPPRLATTKNNQQLKSNSRVRGQAKRHTDEAKKLDMKCGDSVDQAVAKEVELRAASTSLTNRPSVHPPSLRKPSRMPI